MILLGLGGNLGDRQANLEAALAALVRDGAVRLLHVSPVYESAALLPEGAPEEWDIPYYNIVVAAECGLEPEALLAAVKRVEREMGREDVGRWGPRVIDIDILAYDDRIIDGERLTLPHPGMAERDFVLVPLADILPHWRFPCAESPTARELAWQKGMAPGEGLRRTGVELRWPERQGENI